MHRSACIASAVSLVALLPLASAGASVAVDFAGPRAALPFQRPTLVAIGDFNGDGAPDAVSNHAVFQAAASVSVLLGNGEGGLEMRSHASDGDGSSTIVTGDFDDDGNLDAATLHNFNSGYVELHLGTGAGGLEDGGFFDVSSEAADLATGDFDDDGFPDFAIAEFPDRVSTYFGNGAGGFAFHFSYTTTASPDRVFVADCDGDGLQDLVLASSDGSGRLVIETFLGFGAGGFSPSVATPTGQPSDAVAVGDFDEDGLADVASAAPGVLRAYRGIGNGAFEPAVVSPGAADPSDLAFGEFDGDLVLDAAIVEADGNSLRILSGGGDGNFALAFEGPAGHAPGRPVAADMNLDGIDDLLYPAGYVVTVLTSLGGGEFDVAASTALPEARGLGGVAADVNGDGHLDVVSGKGGPSGFVTAMLGDGSGGFSAPIDSVAGSQPFLLAVADFDEDGFDDVVLGKGGGTPIFVMRSLGTGAFEVAGGLSLPATPRGFAIADVDRDGHADLFAVHRTTTLSLFRGRGDATFHPVQTFTGTATAESVGAGDLDDDGWPDVVVSTSGPVGFDVFLGNGAGSLLPVDATPIGATAVPTTPRIADVDGDGRSDVVVTRCFTLDTGRIAVFPGDGNGGLRAGYEIGAPCPDGVALADLDDDGDEDAVSWSRSISVVTAVTNLAAAGARPMVTLGGIVAPSTAVTGDFDEDGAIDVLVIDVGTAGPTFGGGAARPFLHLYRNTSDFRLPGVLAGNVGAAGEDVLTINGSAGVGPRRYVDLAPTAPFLLEMDSPSTLPPGPSAFALFAWVGLARESTIDDAGLTEGPLARPFASVNKRWNNTGDPRFGVANKPSSPAPSVVLRKNGGLRRVIDVTLQGVIADSGSYGVTNGIQLRLR